MTHCQRYFYLYPIAADVLLEAWEHATEVNDDDERLWRDDSGVVNSQRSHDDAGSSS